MILSMILASSMASTVFADSNSNVTCNEKDILGLSKTQLIQQYGEPKEVGETSVYSKTASMVSDTYVVGGIVKNNKALVFDGFVVELSNNDKVTMVICTKRN